MDGAEIRRWANSYNDSYDDSLHEIEQRFRVEFRSQGFITRDQLRKVVEWKLDNQIGRRNLNVDRINRVPDEYIRLVSEAALLIDDPKTQLKTLNSIPGVGYATGSVVLAFYNPERYAVCDRYMVDILLGEDRQMRVTDYPKVLDELRDRNPENFDLRMVEKAYYQRYRVRNGLT